ncbi:hypothetical protein B0H15DRAFT_861292 [Mycena belliarum]|uniref:S-adenosyl-L-methionine-dependent methyltransferase n=1 Tax=Mycena belliarum TaxID=1033014 RepID=A0AAD6XGR8_9AGAR|nr:hypothetical protein B0H15DRAFT_861292 [Mycena belliae]
MKLSKNFGLISDLYSAFVIATLPTVRAIFRRPGLVFRPTEVSRVFMAAVWAAFAAPTDEGARPTKLGLIGPNATGTVMDIGAGLGHSIDYFDQSSVKAYIALEPNALMHGPLRARAAAAGFSEADGSFLVLPYGVEDTAQICAGLAAAGLRVDTMLSIMTLCSIPDPQRSLTALVHEVLVPGGQLLFYEHVRSPRRDVAWWQSFWTPIWKRTFDGCCLDRPTHLWIAEMEDAGGNMWSEQRLWGKEGEPEEHLFWHQVGRFVKHS